MYVCARLSARAARSHPFLLHAHAAATQLIRLQSIFDAFAELCVAKVGTYKVRTREYPRVRALRASPVECGACARWTLYAARHVCVACCMLR